MNAEPTILEKKLAQCEAVIAERQPGDPVRVRREAAAKELRDIIAKAAQAEPKT